MGRENKFLRWVGQTFNGSQLVALSFMLLIFSGALLFMLPISTQDRHGLTFLDALFYGDVGIVRNGADGYRCW